jgi:hypothetical protein
MKRDWRKLPAMLVLAAAAAPGLAQTPPQPPLVSSADQAQDAVVVRGPMPRPIVWGSSNAFRLSQDLKHSGAEPAVKVDPELVARNRRARDESLARAHQQLVERTRLARENENETTRLSRAR